MKIKKVEKMKNKQKMNNWKKKYVNKFKEFSKRIDKFIHERNDQHTDDYYWKIFDDLNKYMRTMSYDDYWELSLERKKVYEKLLKGAELLKIPEKQHAFLKEGLEIKINRIY